VTDTLRPVIVGKAKIGQKVYSEKAGKEIPSKLDHIRFVDHDGNQIQAVHDILGDEPKEFCCVFPSDNPNDFWWPSRRLWKGGGDGKPGMLVCHGDGREAVVKETGQVIECNPETCQSAIKGDCQPTGSLIFLIPEIPSIGCFQIDTRGVGSIRNFQYAIKVLGQVTGGRYTGFLTKISIYEFRTSRGMSWAWQADVLGTPGQVRLAAASAEPQQLLPAEFDEGRPEPEAMPEGLATAPEPAQGMTLEDLRRLAWSRAKQLGWDGEKANGAYIHFLAEKDGDIEQATEAMLGHIEEMITALKQAREELDWGPEFIAEQQTKFQQESKSAIEAEQAFIAQVNHDMQIQTDLLGED
jgi:hypothetical protein